MSKQSPSHDMHVIEIDENKPKRVRRTRKDCDERTFICKTCQRSYLSNAALYTHVKNKHQNVEKEKIQVPEPPKEKQPELPEPQPAPASEDKEFYSQRSEKQQNIEASYCQALEGLRQYMKKYYPERNKGCTIRLICQGLSPEILEYIEPLLKQATELRLSETMKHKLTINKVFGRFLMLMNLRVSSTCINFLIRFFYYLHIAVGVEAKKPNYCQQRTPAELPNYFNSVILNQRIPPPGHEEDEVMYNPIILCKILQHFGYWLYEEGYSDYTVIPSYKQDQ